MYLNPDWSQATWGPLAKFKMQLFPSLGWMNKLSWWVSRSTHSDQVLEDFFLYYLILVRTANVLVDENKTCIGLGIDIFFLGREVFALTLEVGVGSFSFSLNAFFIFILFETESLLTTRRVSLPALFHSISYFSLLRSLIDMIEFTLFFIHTTVAKLAFYSFRPKGVTKWLGRVSPLLVRLHSVQLLDSLPYRCMCQKMKNFAF